MRCFFKFFYCCLLFLVGTVQAASPACACRDESGDKPSFQQYLETQRDLFEVSYPLLEAAVELAPNWRYGYGVIVHDKRFVSEHLRHERGNSSRRLPWIMPWTTVSLIGPNTAAAFSGIRVNDRLLSINGDSVADDTAEQVAERLYRIGRTQQRPTIHIASSRNNRVISNALRGSRLADYEVAVNPSKKVDAFVEGQRLVLTRGILKYASDKEDRALVFAYVLAQALLRDNASLEPESGLEEQIEQVDALALYLLQRAGFAYEHYAHFWNKLASESAIVRAQSFLAENPVYAERLSQITQAISGIEGQVQEEEVVLPPIVMEDELTDDEEEEERGPRPLDFRMRLS